MLKDIKSSFFIKIIFSYIDECRKLKLIKNNKIIQKTIDINIINYIFFSGRYIIYDSNNKVKEYNSADNKVFEVEYLNSLRNGKGKEYKSNSLIFEGEYLNGQRNENGKEYGNSGKLLFEGEYKYGRRWNGKFYYLNNIYELKDGKGYIKEDQDYYVTFEGEYLNGLRDGKGKEYFSENKIVFEGEYKYGKRWNGKFYNGDELKNGKGYIKDYIYIYDIIFEAEYLYGEKNGKGKEYYDENQLFYEGEYLNGEKNGIGKQYYPNGELEFEGEYLYGFKRKGKEYIKGKLIYEGDYLFNKMWNGNVKDGNGNIIYELKDGQKKIFEKK